MDAAAVVAAVDLVGRTGARQLQVGYLNDTPMASEADWWATAQYRGAKITVEHHAGPVDALEALARRLLTGAKCAHCDGLVTLTGAGATFYRGATMADGSMFSERQARSRPLCHWCRQGQRWERGCG